MARKPDEFNQRHSLRDRVTVLEKELAKAREESDERTAVKEIIGSLGERVSKLTAPAWLTAPHTDKGSSPGVPTLFFSDLHHGEVVFPTQIGGVNRFNMSISRDRITHTVETAVYLLGIIDKKLNYPGIVAPLGGDLVSGNIHDELKESNEQPIMPAVLDLVTHLAGAYRRLADVFGRVFVPCVSGNHGRDTRKVYAKNRNATSFDWLICQFLSIHFKDDPRLTFYIPDGSDALYKVYGTRYNLTHGDQFKAGDSIIGPLGPLTRGNQKKQARNQAINQEYEVLLAGHWHSYIHLERLIVNGSLKGYDEYAYQGNFGFEPPRQGLWLTHPRYGITYRMPVLCEAPKKGSPTAEWVSVPK